MRLVYEKIDKVKNKLYTYKYEKLVDYYEV